MVLTLSRNFPNLRTRRTSRSLFLDDSAAALTLTIFNIHPLCSLKRIVAVSFSESQDQKPSDHSKPVQIVRDDRAIRRAVLPSEQRVEDSPPAITVGIRRAAIDVPHTLAYVVAARTSTGFHCAFASELPPRVCLEIPDAFREETGGYEV